MLDIGSGLPIDGRYQPMHWTAVGQVLLLTTVSNSTPVVASKLFGKKFSRALDRGALFLDDKPVFGPSKTLTRVRTSPSGRPLTFSPKGILGHRATECNRLVPLSKDSNCGRALAGVLLEFVATSAGKAPKLSERGAQPLQACRFRDRNDKADFGHHVLLGKAPNLRTSTTRAVSKHQMAR